MIVARPLYTPRRRHTRATWTTIRRGRRSGPLSQTTAPLLHARSSSSALASWKAEKSQGDDEISRSVCQKGFSTMSPSAWAAAAKRSSPPSRFPNRPSRGLHPRAPLRGSLHPSCAACPGCAKPLYTLLQAAPAGCRGALGARQSPQARMAASGDARPGWGCENAVCFAYPSRVPEHPGGDRRPRAGVRVYRQLFQGTPCARTEWSVSTEGPGWGIAGDSLKSRGTKSVWNSLVLMEFVVNVSGLP